METESTTLKAGDVCLDCQQEGLEKRLRYFKLNLNGDTLLKCESDECMYPYNDETSSNDDEAEEEKDNSLNFIEDFIQQISNETDDQNTNQCLSPKAKNDEIIQFDISFLDNFDNIGNENLCKSEDFQENSQLVDNKPNVQIINNQLLSMPRLDTADSQVPVNVNENSYNEQNEVKTSLKAFTNETTKDCKPKIDIQSVECIKMESPLYDIIPNLYRAENHFTIPNNPDKTIRASTSLQSLKISPKKLKSPSNVINPPIQNFSDAAPKSVQPSTTNLKYPRIQTNQPTINIATIPCPELLLPNNSSDCKSETSGIPKANIMKGSVFLREVAKHEEKEKSYIKFRRGRDSNSKNNTKKNIEMPSLSTDLKISCDELSQILNAKKIKKEKV